MTVDYFSITPKRSRGMQPLVQLALAGVWLFAVLPICAKLSWGTWFFWEFYRGWPLVALSLLAFSVALVVFSRLRVLPRAEGVGLVLACLTLAVAGVILVLALSRLYYSRTFLSVNYVLSCTLLIAGVSYLEKARLKVFAVLPGSGEELELLEGFSKVELCEPKVDVSVDGVIVDLHQKLSPEWMRFLSDCALKRIPVHHAAVVFESETGRTSMKHFSAGVLEAVRIPEFYFALKRISDILLVFLSSPVWLPIYLLVWVAIRIDSTGPVLFWQQRMGQGGSPFMMLKFRSMYFRPENAVASFAAQADDRVTRVGRFIRRVRLDEIAQFWNVLKGEMSLIGPRPEQVDFARKFQEEIPYYGCRHLVRPGISGWAQVNQGYASDKGENMGKLEYDLYYIKYFSFWLDALIFLKTIRTMLFGFGAR